jgi:hypothetical protein
MCIHHEAEDLTTQSVETLRQRSEQDDFALKLQSVDDESSANEPKKLAFIANKNSVHVLPFEPPLRLVRRAMKELQDGSMDEISTNKLIGLDPNSAEFRQAYIKLRVESLMRPRSSFIPCSELIVHPERETSTCTSKVNAQIILQPNFNSPWNVKNLGDLWDFFGLWLTFIIALQLYYSFKLGSLLRKFEMLDGNLQINIGRLAIALISLFTSILVLKGCKGQDYKIFIPRLSGIGIVSALIAIVSRLMLEFL